MSDETSPRTEGVNTSENHARRIAENVLAAELHDQSVDGADIAGIVETILDEFSREGFYVVHDSEPPPWMVRVAGPIHGKVYRLLGPDEES